MVTIDYRRTSKANGFTNKLHMKNETYNDIIREHGRVKSWLKTIVHEDITVTITH